MLGTQVNAQKLLQTYNQKKVDADDNAAKDRDAATVVSKQLLETATQQFNQKNPYAAAATLKKLAGTFSDDVVKAKADDLSKTSTPTSKRTKTRCAAFRIRTSRALTEEWQQVVR